MTSSAIAESLTQPVAPVATMSTTNFEELFPPPIANDSSAATFPPETKSDFAEQDKSTTTTIDKDTPVSSNSNQPMDPLPENRNPSPSKETINNAIEMWGTTGSSIPLNNNTPSSQSKDHFELRDPEIDALSLNIKEPIVSHPEIKGQSSNELTSQPIQKQSQSPQEKLLDSFPPCDTSNTDTNMKMPISDSDLTIFNGPNAMFDQTQSWPQQWDPNQTNTAEPGVQLDNYAEPGVQLDGYAKLVFDDSEFYMTTHELTIGRDTQSFNCMRKYEKEQAYDHTAQPTNTILNRSGGILFPWSTPQSEKRSRKGRSRKNSESTFHLSQSGSSNTLNAVPVANGSMTIQTPDPHGRHVLSVHPPFDKGVAGFKSISKKHLRIYYNHREDNFNVEFLGKNGGFVDGQYFAPTQIASLKSGSKLQMGYVFFKFVLPDVIIDDTGLQFPEELEDEVATGTTTYSEGGKEMSLNFDDVPRVGDQRTTDDSELGSDVEMGLCSGDENLFDYDERADDAAPANQIDILNNMYPSGALNEEDQSMGEEEGGGSSVTSPTDTSPKPEKKKRGPGRPPKDGIMSKREQQIAKKEAMERERVQEEERAQEADMAEEQHQEAALKTPPGKNKVGRPRKHPRPDVSEEGPPRQKRKYTKRTAGPKETEEADGDKFDEDGKPIEAGSQKKISYVLKKVTHVKEECTQEQLTRPPSNYLEVIMIILEAAKMPLCLPQIYNEMEVKYPYYAFQESKGWQSSVRHNLGQHKCFVRTAREGKGWAWSVKPGSTYLKEKKKKALSPPVAGGNQPIYQAGHPPMGYGANQNHPPPYPYHNPHPQGEYQQYQPQPGQPYMGPNPHYMPYPAQGYAPPFIPPMAPQLAPTAPASYSSPYGPKPPAATTQPQGIQQQQQQQPPQQQQPLQQQPPQQHLQQPHYQPQKPPQPPNTSQSPVLPQQPQLAAGSQTQASPQAVPQAAPQATPASVHQKRVISPHSIAAITGYRNHVVNLMRKKASQNDPEALVDRAIQRVYDSTEEDRSLDTTEHEMKLINGVLNILKLPLVPRTSSSSTGHTQQQNHPLQQPSQPPVNQNKPQGNTSQQPGKTTGPDLPKQTIMRPSFYGSNQNQSSGSSVPRPPLMTPGLQRSNSGSAQNTSSGPNTASSSSAPANSSNSLPQAVPSSNNKTSGATPPVGGAVNQTITQAVDQNGTTHGLKAGETLTEAGFVRSFPQPQIST